MPNCPEEAETAYTTCKTEMQRQSASPASPSPANGLRGEALCTRVGGTVENNGCRCGAAPSRWINFEILEKDPKGCGDEAQQNPDPAVLAKACRDGNGSWNATDKKCRCGDNTFEVAGMFVGGGLDEFVTRCKADSQRAGGRGTFAEICQAAGGTINGTMCRCGMGASYSEQIIRGDNGNNCRTENADARRRCESMSGSWQGGGRCLCGSTEYPGGSVRCSGGRWSASTSSPTAPSVGPQAPRPPAPPGPGPSPVSNQCRCTKYQQGGHYCGWLKGNTPVGNSRYGAFPNATLGGWACGTGGPNDLCTRNLPRPSGC